MRKPRQKKYYAPQNEEHVFHKCDFPECEKRGEYRAPKNRKLKEYYWFCLEHVQQYNAKWNYYEGISTDEPEEDNQPKMHFKGFRSKVRYSRGYDFFDDYEFFESSYHSHSDYAPMDEVYYTYEERRYLEIMELEGRGLNIETLKKQYKQLVKKYHPDLHQDNKAAAEEKFKQLSNAYQHLLDKLNRLYGDIK